MNLEEDAAHHVMLSVAQDRRPGLTPRLDLTVRDGASGEFLFELPKADIGLVCGPGIPFYHDGRHYKGRSLEGDVLTVEAERHSRLRYVFEHRYALQFGPEALALERPGPERAVRPRGTLLRWHLRGEFVRTTARYSATDEVRRPLADALAPAWYDFDEQTRTQRVQDAESILPIRFELTPDTTAGPEDLARSALAFTLAATLKDVVFSQFPGLGHRIAVASPDAAAILEEMGRGSAGDSTWRAATRVSTNRSPGRRSRTPSTRSSAARATRRRTGAAPSSTSSSSRAPPTTSAWERP